MRNDEATRLFKEANELYQEQRYSEALQALDRLDKAFPQEKKIMRPRARCLFKLNRRREAHAVCEDLVERFDDDKAKRMLTRLDALQAEQQAATLNLDDLFGEDDLNVAHLGENAPAVPEQAGAAPAQPSGGVSTGTWAMIGIAVLVVGFGVYGVLTGKSDEPAEPPPVEVAETTPTAPETETPVPDATEPAAPPEEEEPDAEPPSLAELMAPTQQTITVPFNGQRVTQGGAEYYVNPTTGDLLPVINGLIHAPDPDTQELRPLNEGPYFYTTDEVPEEVIEPESAGDPTAVAQGEPAWGDEQLSEEELKEALAIVIAVAIGGVVVLWLFGWVLPLYLTVMITNKLPGKGAMADFFSVFLIGTGTFLCFLLVPCIGVFLASFILHKTYELSIVEYLIFLGMFVGVAFLMKLLVETFFPIAEVALMAGVI